MPALREADRLLRVGRRLRHRREATGSEGSSTRCPRNRTSWTGGRDEPVPLRSSSRRWVSRTTSSPGQADCSERLQGAPSRRAIRQFSASRGGTAGRGSSRPCGDARNSLGSDGPLVARPASSKRQYRLRVRPRGKPGRGRCGQHDRSTSNRGAFNELDRELAAGAASQTGTEPIGNPLGRRTRAPDPGDDSTAASTSWLSVIPLQRQTYMDGACWDGRRDSK